MLGNTILVKYIEYSTNTKARSCVKCLSRKQKISHKKQKEIDGDNHVTFEELNLLLKLSGTLSHVHFLTR